MTDGRPEDSQADPEPFLLAGVFVCLSACNYEDSRR